MRLYLLAVFCLLPLAACATPFDFDAATNRCMASAKAAGEDTTQGATLHRCTDIAFAQMEDHIAVNNQRQAMASAIAVGLAAGAVATSAVIEASRPVYIAPAPVFYQPTSTNCFTNGPFTNCHSY